MLEDEEIEKMNETELKNLAINCYSCLKEKGKKIHYISFMKQIENQDCNNAIKRIFVNISVDAIKNFIDGIECLSSVRKNFYKNIIEQRYYQLKNIYENIK